MLVTARVYQYRVTASPVPNRTLEGWRCAEIAQDERLDDTLWSALRVIEKSLELWRRLPDRAEMPRLNGTRTP
jgi:hypothetical protein